MSILASSHITSVFLLFQLFNKLVFLVSFVGNQGTFTRGYQAVVMDMLFIYHLGYAIICVLGLFVHEFFYSFLVRNLSHVSAPLQVWDLIDQQGASETNTVVLNQSLWFVGVSRYSCLTW